MIAKAGWKNSPLPASGHSNHTSDNNHEKKAHRVALKQCLDLVEQADASLAQDPDLKRLREFISNE